MIPGSIGAGIGLLLCLAALACIALGVRSAAYGLADIARSIRTGTPTHSDSGTAAVLFAGGFVLFMLARVATA